MQAQDKLDIDTFYEVHLDRGNKHHFCKRYQRKRNAKLMAAGLDAKYGPLGYTTRIDVIEIPRDRLRPQNGGHTVGTPPQEQGTPPTE